MLPPFHSHMMDQECGGGGVMVAAARAPNDQRGTRGERPEGMDSDGGGKERVYMCMCVVVRGLCFLVLCVLCGCCCGVFVSPRRVASPQQNH